MKTKKLFILLASILIMIAIVLDPLKYITAANNGILVFAINVIPSLFPFMFFSKVIAELNYGGNFGLLGKGYLRTFRVPQNTFYIYLMSAICGYPIGAKLTAEKYQSGQLTALTARKLTTFCSNGSMIFILGTIGSSILKSPIVGIFIYLACVLSCAICGFFYGIIKRKEAPQENNQIIFSPPNSNLLQSCMTNTIISLFIVGGYIVLFYVISEILFTYKILYPLSLAFGFLLSPLQLPIGTADILTIGMCEFTKGCIMTANLGLHIPIAAAICAFFLGFGGISVLMQSMTYLSSCSVPVWFYLVTKIAHGLIAAILTYFFVLPFYLT